MAAKIGKKITSYKVKAIAETTLIPVPAVQPLELLERDQMLTGATYKIKPVGSDHAWYVTINDLVVEDGSRKPYEMFINTKDVAHFQWVQIMTRLVSAVWRNGGKTDFVIEEMMAVVSPGGGYFAKDKGFQPSLVAHIGLVVKEHIALHGAPSKHATNPTHGGKHA